MDVWGLLAGRIYKDLIRKLNGKNTATQDTVALRRLPTLILLSQFTTADWLFISLVPLTASEPGEIPGPESGYYYNNWLSDDKVVALKTEYEFLPDKLNYDFGEIIKVTYNISVDTASRGYLPNRTYYLLSPFVDGYQISGSTPLYWRIMKSEIDTLEVITDDKPLKGEFTLQLVHYKDKPQKKQLGDDSFMYFTPVDTTKANTGSKSRPPSFQFYAYRVATRQTGANVHQHSSGKFYFDQQGGIPLEGKTQRKRTQETLKRGYYAPSTKDNTYLPPQPDFKELAQGGIPGNSIKTLRNTVLNWRINNDAPPSYHNICSLNKKHIGVIRQHETD